MNPIIQQIIARQQALDELATAENRNLTSAEQTEWDQLDERYNQEMAKSDKPIVGANGLLEKRYDTQMLQATHDNYRFAPEGTDLRDAFNRYLLDGLPALNQKEWRALSMDNDKSGGFLTTPKQVADNVIIALNNAVFIRELSTTYQVPNAQSLGLPALDTDISDPQWSAELTTGGEDSDMDFQSRDLYPHPLARRIKVSNKLMRASQLNPEKIVTDRMIYKIAVAQENGFLNGTGSNQPLGVFTASNSGIPTSRDVSTGNTTTSLAADNLINVAGSLAAQYKRNATWILHRDVVTYIRKLKDGEGNYLWAMGLSGAPNTILGHPYMESEYAPNTFTSGSYLGILGDFSFYSIADAMNMQIQRLTELYAETNQTGFICRIESDGMPVLPEAFARITLA